MAEHTVTIPGEYVEFFKLGVPREIETDCGALVDNVQEFSKKVFEMDHTGAQRTGRNIGYDLELLAQLPVENTADDVTISARDGETLGHAMGATARAVLRPRLDSDLMIGPYEKEVTEEIRRLVEAIRWAVSVSEHFESIAVEEQSQERLDRDLALEEAPA